MNDPTYELEVINANRLWKIAFELSEYDNDAAPIGWSKYITMASCVMSREKTYMAEIERLRAEIAALKAERDSRQAPSPAEQPRLLEDRPED